MEKVCHASGANSTGANQTDDGCDKTFADPVSATRVGLGASGAVTSKVPKSYWVELYNKSHPDFNVAWDFNFGQAYTNGATSALFDTTCGPEYPAPLLKKGVGQGIQKQHDFWDVVAGSYCDASEKLKLDCGQSKANGTFQKNDVNNICHGFSCDLPRANNGQPAPVDVAVTTLCASGNCVLESYGEEKPGVYDQRQNMDQVNAALKQLQEKIEKEKYKYKNVGLWFGWKNPQTIRKVERKTKFFDYNSRSIMNLNHNSQDPKHPYNFIDYQWDQENEIWAWQFTGMGFHPKAGTCPALK